MFNVTNLYGINSNNNTQQKHLDTVIESPTKSYIISTNNNNNMKYHTLSTSSIATEGKKSSFTIYADIMDFKHEKLEAELLSARRELEGVQTALHQQTQRCRELVTEFSKKLQSKEIQIHSERQLRDQQLTKVLRALLLFEARLVKEQKHIRQQLQEKDTIIYNQQIQIKKLEEPTCNCCKNGPQSSSSTSTQESSLSSLETHNDFHHNWSRCAILLPPPPILDNRDSCSDVYASISENDYKTNDQLSVSSEETNIIRRHNNFERKNSFIKNKQNYTKNDLKRMKKYSTSRNKNTNNSNTYYEVIKRRNDLCADSSSNDDEIKDITVTDNINDVSKRIENVFDKNKESIRLSQSYSERIDNLHGIKRIPTTQQNGGNSNRNGSITDELYTSSSFSGDSSTTTSTNYCSTGDIRGSYEPNGNFNCYSSTKSDSEMTTTSKNNIDDGFAEGDIEIFELNDDDNESLSKEIVFVFDDNNKTHTDDPETNWYAYASDQEDDQKCDLYKDNPVLECMNQILLQNINDSIHSPPKSPIPASNNTTLTKSKSPKRVKFLDDSSKEESSEKEETPNKNQDDYYETPIQNVANVYEVPQSIYSNDYEQILINRNDNTKWPKLENLQEKEINRMSTQKLYVIKNIELNDDNDYYYVDMDAKSDSTNSQGQPMMRKYPRIPPALPPKPANLVSKYKIHGKPLTAENLSIMNSKNIERPEEPDYCSISELNMAAVESHPTAVVVNTSSNIAEVSDVHNVSSLYDQIIGNAPNIVSKCSTSTSPSVRLQSSNQEKHSPRQTSEKKKIEPEIPKLPQVSEIIIPSESDTESKDENISVTHDNYIKNNSQLFKKKTAPEKYKTPIVMGTSVSSLITGFNNQHIMAELNSKVLANNAKKSPRKSTGMFTNFELNQNSDKQLESHHQLSKSTSDIPLSFEKFDLSQNFEEFNLDDCEITEEYHIDDICDEDLTPTKDLCSDKKITNLSPNKNITNIKQIKSLKYNNKEVKTALLPQQQQQPTVLPIQNNKTTIINNNNNNNNVPKTNTNSVIPHQTLLTYESQQPNYEHFLECTGLSSKSILTPSRLLSNHKSMLKPKDVKLRNKVRTYATVEKQQNVNTIKYYSEPYL